jgi:dTDP-4-dehydrorhamnose reductase
MRVLLLGKNGQVGWELQRALAPLGPLVALGREQADLLRPQVLPGLIAEYRPDVVVNAAAYTAVDKAEADAAAARLVNAEAVAVLAAEARRRDCWLVHYSTDYVFDGRKGEPYFETDRTNPQNVYGLTKRDADEAIRDSGCKHLIFRTSWVYGRHGNNFAKTMLRLAAERPELRIVDDQVGAPTSAELIANVTALALHQIAGKPEDRSGIYHLVAAGETSWHGYASFLLGEARRRGARLAVTDDNILPIRSADYPLPAVRPGNSRLDTEKLSRVFGLTPPHWQIGVRRLVAELVPGATR